MNIVLDSVYNKKDLYFSTIYQLLGEREENESISHNGMPTWQQHTEFVERRPYKGWYIILVEDKPVGSIYISFSNEIGISIFKRDRRKGYGKAAIELLMLRHIESFYLANINPMNTKSIDLFQGHLGFKHIQNTYKLMPKGKNDVVS